MVHIGQFLVWSRVKPVEPYRIFSKHGDMSAYRVAQMLRHEIAVNKTLTRVIVTQQTKYTANVGLFSTHNLIRKFSIRWSRERGHST